MREDLSFGLRQKDPGINLYFDGFGLSQYTLFL